jgi:hypothetical protein
MSSAIAVSNARDASRELCRLRVEREEVELFVAAKNRTTVMRRRETQAD